MPIEPILVTGAAGGIQGSTGFHVTRLLLDKGWPVRAFVHRLDDRSDRLRTLGAEIVDGDLQDFRSVAAAMGGIQRAYFAYPVQEGLLDAAATFAAAARSAGIEQVVNLSQWLQEGGEQPTPHQARHWLVEQIFDWAHVGAVHLDATVFYENLRTWALLSLARERQLERYRTWRQSMASYPRRWREAGNDSEYVFYLTVEELEQLTGDLTAILMPLFRKRMADPSKRPRGSVPVQLLLHRH